MRQLQSFCWTAALWATTAVGCGYRPVHAPSPASLCVRTGQILIPEALVAEATVFAARAELAGAGALAGGLPCPRLVIDVLRVDERSRGIYSSAGQPHARGMSIAVVARGRVSEGEGLEATIDTGDVRRAVQLSGDSDPRLDSAARDDALRAAAERTGRAIARIALGLPEPAEDVP